jgi:hypothetical protein
MADDPRKTRPTEVSVASFLDTVPGERRRAEAEEALALMRDVTGAEPVMWGPSMIGFGRHPYITADGKEHESFAIGLSPRKAALTLYGLTLYGSNADLLDRLGPHTVGKSCLYVKQLDALDHGVLTELIERSWRTNQDPGDRPVRSG